MNNSKPYYAVIFTSVKSDCDDGYQDMASKMLALAQKMPGFLGFESARSEVGISVSYWESLEDILHWKNHPEHQKAQKNGRIWYEQYTVRICKVEREYSVNFQKEK